MTQCVSLLVCELSAPEEKRELSAPEGKRELSAPEGKRGLDSFVVSSEVLVFSVELGGG